ncbi:MAG: hypothetical protein WD491_00900 [Balneolales bacterium]
MQQNKFQKINVTALFSSFKMQGVARRITPITFRLKSGDEFEVSEIRRSYVEHVGDTQHVHFVVHTKQNRYFDIVYDSKKMGWALVLELDDGFMVE